MKSTDNRKKRFEFHYTVTDYFKDDFMKTKGLDHIEIVSQKLKKLQVYFDMISRNIFQKNDVDKDLA